VAVGLALLVAHPQLVLVAMAYTYLASGLIGLAWQRLRRKSAVSMQAAGSEQPAATGEVPERRAE
jgi:hypothetical protein